MLYVKLGAVLCIFWLFLSGHTEVLLLTLGLASVLLVLWLIARMDRNDHAPSKMLFGLELLRYLGWLIWQVVLTNIDVVRRIWDPSMPVRPAWRKLDVKVKDPLCKTIYANSITLTPGTVTTEVGEDYFIVHALDEDGIDELAKGEMEARVQRLEPKP